MEHPQRNNRIVHWLRNLLCGALIGAGAILPGVSGGVLAVIFDIYRPMMEVLTHPRRAIPNYWKWSIPLGIGWLIGFWGFARGVAAALHISATVTTWLFIGLIAGTVPALFRQAGKEGRSAASWVSFALCALGMFATLFYVGHVLSFQAQPGFGWYTFCGVLWGMSVVIPGLTTASILMALGLYQPVLAGLSQLDIGVMASCLPGMAAAVAVLARLVSWFFRRYYSAAFHGILGIVLASTLAILPTQYTGAGEAALSALCCVGGFALAHFLDRLDRRIRE